MSIALETEPRIRQLRVTDDEIVADLVDGRIIAVPLVWSWRLADATPAQRANFRFVGHGLSVHWPDIDEDLSVEGMLRGVPARRPATRSRRPARRETQRRSRPAQLI